MLVTKLAAVLKDRSPGNAGQLLRIAGEKMLKHLQQEQKHQSDSGKGQYADQILFFQFICSSGWICSSL